MPLVMVTSVTKNYSRSEPSPEFSGSWFISGSGLYFTSIVKDDGNLFSFGQNDKGQLGRAENQGTNTPTPSIVSVLDLTIKVMGGERFSAALKSDGTLWTCGSNMYGQLGDSRNLGVDTYNSSYTQVATNIIDFTVGNNHLLAIKDDNTLWSCGLNQRGQLGHTTNSGTTIPNPTLSQIMTDAKKVFAGSEHSLVIKSDDTLWTFGNSGFGRLGNNSGGTIPAASPTPSQVATDVKSAAGGHEHSIIVKNTGAVFTCGRARYGQLGFSTGFNNSTAMTKVFTAVTTGISSNATVVDAGYYHSIVLLNTGSVLTFGQNIIGQLGRSGVASAWQPTSVFTDAADVAASGGNTIVRKNDNTIYTCGGNDYGQLGTTGRNLGTTTPNYNLEIIVI